MRSGQRISSYLFILVTLGITVAQAASVETIKNAGRESIAIKGSWANDSKKQTAWDMPIANTTEIICSREDKRCVETRILNASGNNDAPAAQVEYKIAKWMDQEVEGYREQAAATENLYVDRINKAATLTIRSKKERSALYRARLK